MFTSFHRRNWRTGSGLSAVFLVLGAVTGLGDALDSLHLRNPLPTPESVHTIGFGDGKFLAADLRGDVFTSVNGTSWTAVGNVGTNYLTKVVYGNGRFVATSFSGNILSTADGTVWDLVPLTVQNRIQDIAFGNGIFLIALSDLEGKAVIGTSVDGFNWTTNTPALPGPGGVMSMAFGDGVFAMAASGYIHTSPDGVMWTSHVPQGDEQQGTYYSAGFLGYGNGRFILNGSVRFAFGSPVGAKWISTNHVDWVRITSPQDPKVIGRSVTFGNGVFFADGNFVSVNGVTWLPVTLPSGLFSFGSVAFGNGTFVGLSGGGMATSTDAVNWTKVAIVPAPRGFAATGGAYGVGRYVFSGNASITSTDGINFTSLNFSVNGAPAAINCVVYGGGQFLAAIGSYNTGSEFMRSSDGMSWSRARSGTLRRLNSIAYGAGKYVAVGDNGVIRISSDGALWTGGNSDTEYHLYGVAYGRDRFVAVGMAGLVLTSGDGVNWTQRANPDFSDLTGVVFGADQFVAVGAGGSVVTSPDGTTWTRQSTGITNRLNNVTYGDGLYVAVSSSPIGTYSDGKPINDGRVFTSSDGIQWRERLSNSFGPVAGAAFLNNTFMLMGNGGTILQSDPVGVTVLRAAASSSSGTFEVQISNSELGGLYRLQSCTNLAAGIWMDVTTFTQTQPVTTVAVPGGVGAPQCYYRAVTP